MRRALLSLLVVAGVLIGGCAGTYHGRTMTRGEVVLVYDPGVQVYVVESRPDVYYASGFYFRYASGSWVRSRQVMGPWEPCPMHHVPSGLRGRWDHDRGRHRGHGRGRG